MTQTELALEEGYLIDPNDWTEEVARRFAREEGIELGADYWPILHFMRSYWRKHRVAPDVRHVLDFLNREAGWDKRAAKRHLFKLFPYGYVQQACRIAGMQRPRAWSTG